MAAIKLVLFTLFASSFGQQYRVGDVCPLDTTRNSRGICKRLQNCPYAMDLLKIKQTVPQHCGFSGTTPIVCCLDENSTTTNLPLRISQEKCRDDLMRNYVVAAFHGTPSLVAEFPHMAILGYGDPKDIQWLCGGSLISDRFVLTAAHCLYSTKYGDVKIVRLGDLDIKNTTEPAAPQDFGVLRTYRHPDYKPPSKYHDIALIHLDKDVYFGIFIRPACLFTHYEIPKATVTATGWGITDFAGQPSSHLLKVTLSIIDNNTCREAYSNAPARQLEQGIMDNFQICAGDAGGMDTCPGDSGGPLQLHYNDATINRHYFLIIGVTSFGKACGFNNSVGVYTRVSEYVPWIESIAFREDYTFV